MKIDNEFFEENRRRIAEVKRKAESDGLGYLKVHYEGVNYFFPKAALLWYVYGKSAVARPLLPEYQPVCYSGMKMLNDCPYHNDVILGSGVDDSYHEALYEATRQLKEEYKQTFNFDFTVLADGRADKDSYFWCLVYEYEEDLPEGCSSNIHIQCAETPENDWDDRRCVVIPEASVEYEDVCRNADVVITERGGALCHMSIVSLEKGKLLLRVDNAIELFPKWSRLQISLTNMTMQPKV